MSSKWPYRVEPGDWVVEGNHLRKVLEVGYDKDGYTKWVALPILRLSWTKRPYTHMNCYDLARRNIRPLGEKL